MLWKNIIHIYKYLKDGDTFGELALIQNGKRTATAVTIENCELFVLNGVTFREILKKINETDLNEKMNLLKSNALFSVLGNNKLKAISNIMIKCTFKGGIIFYFSYRRKITIFSMLQMIFI